MKKLIYILIIAAIVICAFAYAALSNNASAAGSGVYNNLKYEIKNGKAIITGYVNEPSGDLVIPEKIDGCSVTEIKDDAFFGCAKIKSVSMPSVEYIGAGAFDFCENIKKADIPKVLSVGEYAFYGCALTELNLPVATEVGERSFAGYEECPMRIKRINAPKLEYVGKNAFEFCFYIDSISAPNLKTIDAEAFSLCTALKSIDLPSAETVGDGAFSFCFSLTDVRLPKVKTIGNFAFSNWNMDLLIYSDDDAENLTSIKSVYLPEVQRIGAYAFYQCAELQSVSLPSVTFVGVCAFDDCYELQSVSMPNVKVIDECAFYMCLDLKTVEMPNVEIIERVAFYTCSIDSVKLYNVQKIGDYAF